MDKNTKYWLIGIGVGTVVLGTLVYLYSKESKTSGGGKKLSKKGKWFDPSLKWYQTSSNQTIVNKLHPAVRNKFKEFLSRIEKQLGLIPYLTSGYRTWEKQAKLKKENPSNAAPGYSAHNYGFALDINIDDQQGNRILMKADSDEKWINSGIVSIAKEMGFTWGGDFATYHDPIHFHIDPIPRDQMRARYLAGQKIAGDYIVLSEQEQNKLVA